jgi:hypothetical protein
MAGHVGRAARAGLLRQPTARRDVVAAAGGVKGWAAVAPWRGPRAHAAKKKKAGRALQTNLFPSHFDLQIPLFAALPHLRRLSTSPSNHRPPDDPRAGDGGNISSLAHPAHLQSVGEHPPLPFRAPPSPTKRDPDSDVRVSCTPEARARRPSRARQRSGWGRGPRKPRSSAARPPKEQTLPSLCSSPPRHRATCPPSAARLRGRVLARVASSPIERKRGGRAASEGSQRRKEKGITRRRKRAHAHARQLPERRCPQLVIPPRPSATRRSPTGSLPRKPRPLPLPFHPETETVGRRERERGVRSSLSFFFLV